MVLVSTLLITSNIGKHWVNRIVAKMKPYRIMSLGSCSATSFSDEMMYNAIIYINKMFNTQNP